MPVAVSPIDWQARAVLCKLRLKRRDEPTILFIDGTFAAELVIVLGNFHHALAGYVFPAQYILQEWHDVGRLLRTSEGGYENRVIDHAVCAQNFLTNPWRRFHGNTSNVLNNLPVDAYFPRIDSNILPSPHHVAPRSISTFFFARNYWDKDYLPAHMGYRLCPRLIDSKTKLQYSNNQDGIRDDNEVIYGYALYGFGA